MECFNRELRSMSGGRRNATNDCENVFSLERCSRPDGLAAGQFRDCRTTSHGWNAPFGLKPDFGNDVPLQRCAQFEHVSADGIFYLRRRLRIRQNPWISRVLEMIEKLRRIHESIVGRHLLSY